MPKSFWLKKALKFVFAATLFVAAATYATMSLWNWLVPEIFHGPLLSFWQALGLLALSRLLLGGFGRGGGSPWARSRAWKQRVAQRMAHLSPEERETFKQQLEKRCAAWNRPGAEMPVR